MKAAFIREPGLAEAIVYCELPDPVPEPDQVLVRTRAVAVNPIDTYIRGGAAFWELAFPYVVGSDVAGEVIGVGSAVTDFKLGDRVWGSNQGFFGRQGTFSEMCCIASRWLYPLPEAIPFEDGAAGALVGLTAHLGLFRESKLQPGELVFVQGGSGGVGSAVVQMAKAAGATVITTAGSQLKAAACQALGADHVICYQTQDVREAIDEFAPDGVDVAWETQRDADMDLLVHSLAQRGRLIVMAGRDARPEFPVGPFYVKEARMIGFVMFKAPPEIQREAADSINEMLVQGTYKPRIDRVMPLSEAAAAHRLQEASTVGRSGKLVLVPE